MPAALRRGAGRAPRTPRRSRPRPIALLILGPLLCVIALTSLGYVGLSQQARQDAQAQIGMAAQAAHGALIENMGAVAVKNGQLTSALPANVMLLNNNNAEAQRLRAQIGADVLIVEQERGASVVVASSLAASRAGGAPLGLGERLTGAIATNTCASPAAARPTTATLTLDGTDYAAGSVPLIDASGACVGAVVALKSTSGLQSIPMEYTVILAMAGALLSLLTVAVGLALHGRGDAGSEAAQAERLRAALATLDEAEAACVTQMAQREWVSRRLDAGRRRLEHALTTLAVDRIALQDTTSDIWAGVSQPGAPIDPAAALRLAREGAVVAARVGSRLNDFDAIANMLFSDLEVADEVDALLDDALAQTEAAIAAVRAASGAGEADAAPVAARVSPVRRPTAPGDVYATNILEAQRRYTGQAYAAAPGAAPRQSGAYRAMRPDSAQQRAMGGRGATRYTPAPGQTPRPRQTNGMGASGMYPQQGAPGASGMHPQQGAPGASGRYRAANSPQAPRPPYQAPRQNPDLPPDGRDRDSSGSRWLND